MGTLWLVFTMYAAFSYLGAFESYIKGLCKQLKTSPVAPYVIFLLRLEQLDNFDYVYILLSRNVIIRTKADPMVVTIGSGFRKTARCVINISSRYTF